MVMQERLTGTMLALGCLREGMRLDEEAELKWSWLCPSLRILACVGTEVIAQRYKDDFA